METLSRKIKIVLVLGFSVLFSGHTEAFSSIVANNHIVRDKRDKAIIQDHSEIDDLRRTFERGADVTATCLGCHEDTGKEIFESQHWTWTCPTDGSYHHGKSGLTLNNLTISPVPNKFACYNCHISYRWEDYTLSLDSPENIDCLICHEQTNGLYDAYRKDWNPYLNQIAQNIGRPTKRNCGVCHFNKSGGDGILRGDLSSKLLDAERGQDVHMDRTGPNMECIDCHITTNHNISGRCYGNPATLSASENKQRYDCTFCHNQNLHGSLKKMNDHTNRVACQTCHIPLISRDLYSRIWIDYSKAGQKKDGKTMLVKDKHGNKQYSTNSGEWKWAKNIQPEYLWFTGGLNYTLATDRIDPSGLVKLNGTNADYHTPQSKIYPFKVHRAMQPYDKVNNTMVLPKFTDRDKNSGAYWIDHDWNKAIKAGMAEAGLQYGGEYGFVETEYIYPIHHSVMPKENALKCTNCHKSGRGRLEKLKGFYMPGRDRSIIIDYGGAICVLLTLTGVLFHAGNCFSIAKRGK